MMNAKRLPELDGIRGLAILLVLIWHYVALGVPIDPGSKLFRVVFYLRNTWAGVDLFFVLSGFLIGGILLDARNSPHYFKTFFIRRAFRILPLYFLFLLTFELLVFLTTKGYSTLFIYLTQGALPSYTYWLFIQNIYSTVTGLWGSHWHGVTWSLAVEEQFYLTLPFVIRFVPQRLLLPVVCALVAAAPVLRTICFYTLEGDRTLATYWLMPCRTDALGLGVIGAILLRSEKGRVSLLLRQRVLWIGFALGLTAFIHLSMIGQGVGTFHTALWGHSAFAILFFSVLMLAVTKPQSVIGWCMRLWPLQRLGIIAYGVYLLHYPVLIIAHQYWLSNVPSIVTLPQQIVTAAAFIITIIIAEISWRYFEKPLVDKGKRFTY